MTGKICGAVFCTHVPRLFMPEAKRREYIGEKGTSFFDAFEALYTERIKNSCCDTFLVIDTHWWSTLSFLINAHDVHQGVYTSQEIPEMIAGYKYDYKGDSQLADMIVTEAREIDMPPVIASRAQGLSFEYPTLVPMHFLNPDSDRAVVPMSIAYTSSVLDELKYGTAIRQAVEKSGKNVIIVASGGLSHRFHNLNCIAERTSPDVANIYSETNREYDQHILGLMRNGQHQSILDLVEQFRDSASPEGRFAHYVRMIGALGGESFTGAGHQYGKYESAIGTGQAIVWFDGV